MESVNETLEKFPPEDDQPDKFDPETLARLRKEDLKRNLRRLLRPTQRRPKEWADSHGFVAVDVLGNSDVDYDNPGPTLNRECQSTGRGCHSVQHLDSLPAMRKKELEYRKAVYPYAAAHGTDTISKSDEEDPGSLSSSSEVSQDRCHVSPFYPPCGPDCWLKKVEAIPASHDITVPASKAHLGAPKI